MNAYSQYYVYTPLEHTITNMLWAVFVCVLIALIVVWISKSRRIKQLEADIRRLQDGLINRNNTKDPASGKELETALCETDETERRSFRSIIVDWFLNLSLFVRFILTLVLSAMPFVVLGLPWWADVLIFLVIQTIPIIGTVGHLGIYIWALVVEIQSGRSDIWSVLFYVSFALFVFAFVIPLILLFFRRDTKPEKTKLKANRKHVLICVFIVSIAAVLIIVDIPGVISSNTRLEEAAADHPNLSTTAPTAKPTSTPRPITTPKPLQEVPFPAYNTAIGSDGFGDCGTLTINSSSTYKYTFLSIVPIGLSSPSIRVYMHGGDTYDVEVPYGTYHIYCAEGDKYYGTTDLFGQSGIYSKLDDTFKFYEDDEYIYGHTLTLYSVYNGNLDSGAISLANFPT